MAKNRGKGISNIRFYRTKRPPGFTKLDYVIMIIVTLIYAVIALHDLGYKYAPSVYWESAEAGSQILIDLGEDTDVSKVSAYLGTYHKRHFTVEVKSDSDADYTVISDEDTMLKSVYRWNDLTIGQRCRYIRLTSESDKAAINELVVVSSDDMVIMPVNSSEYAELYDEQDMYPSRSTFRDSTYFDEIYHARTAYEYLHGLYSYENTHPPLGKIFISIGIGIFGMNPFGWRIAGTVFGILMVPIVFTMGKKMFNKTWLATVACLLYTFDFMHFVQTRIATIDVYVTFFIMLMYFFMYMYSTMSFNDTPLKKTFIPLGACGVTMGLGVASKWTGVYAGIGLAVIFFTVMYRRYREYRMALLHKKAEIDGIKCIDVINNYKTYTIKTICFCMVFFVLIPIIIYVLAYIPFRNSNPDASLLSRVVDNIKTMYEYHSTLKAEHNFSSEWYKWPIMYRPVWYYSGHVSEGISEGISAFGNPLVWWAGIPAFAFMCYRVIKRRDGMAAFLCVGYLAQYVPWMFVTRYTFMYHYFPDVIFVVLMIVYSIKLIADRLGESKVSRAAICYCVLAIGLFAMFYPVLSGQPVSTAYVNRFLKWFSSWVLVS